LKRVLITGGAGGVGRELTAALVARGYRVRVFDLPQVNFAGIEGQPEIEIVRGDITNHSDVWSAVREIDTVLHVAALLPPASERNRTKTFAVNVEGTSVLAQAIREAGGRARLVFTSTVATYGDTTGAQPPIRAGHPQRPNSVYSESKVAAERAILDAGITSTILRVSAIVTPALQDPPEWPFVADQRMEFVCRADVVRALIAAVDRDEAADRILNVAGGRSWQMLGREYIAATFPILGIPVEDATYPEAPLYSDWYDTSESQAILDYQQTPFPTFLEQLDRAVAEAIG
jgi:nucleoside-diphosphate-sugar epimerase